MSIRSTVQPSEPTPRLRSLRAGDIPDAMELKTAAGWNQTEDDWRLYLEVAPGGCFALEAGGKVVATSTAIPYRPVPSDRPPEGPGSAASSRSALSFGWVGMVLVHPEHRRRGHGTRMLEAATRFLEECGVVPALDATPLGRPLYESRGFTELSGVERRVGTARPPPSPRTAGAKGPAEASLEVAALRVMDLEEVLRLDLESFGADRLRVIDGFLRRKGSIGLLCRSQKGVEGYLVGREGGLFYHVGPWVARTPDAAAALWRSCLEGLVGRSVGVDVLVRNEEARRLAEEAGLPAARSLVRMVRWRGPPPNAPPPGGRADRIYGLAGFEWG